ncbi:MAG TPA: response regulator transcription factor [Pirellulaceae bacterium]|nr:response regulator transcription factor [Pirellulaceae bacterium]
MSSRPAKVKILVVDDHPLVRQGLSMRIEMEPDWEVCGEAAGVDDALSLAAQTNPDLMLIDISLKGGHGIDLVKQVKSRHPVIKMLVISGFQESLYAERALRAGALGYINKQDSNEKLISAIQTVLAGQRFVSPETQQRLLDQALSGREMVKSPEEQLSDRELEIFHLIGEGVTSGAIANQLMLSTHTIDSHRESIKRKLGLKNVGELTRAAVQWVLENG